MRMGVLGTGMVGRAISAKLRALGHDVVVGTRDPIELMERAEPDARGNDPFAVWQERHPDVRVATFREAAEHGELVVNATSGAASIAALSTAGEEHLAGKVLIDVANPLDHSGGTPPTLFVSNTDSLAEQIQRAFPSARVVKTLNTVTAVVMVDPASVADGHHTVFVSGDDREAKQEVIALLTDGFGWKDVLDLGDLATARATEAYVTLWVAIMMQRGPLFNVAVVQ
jgi:8-hydroxy-5-deazaflavin:NADPH oxidoreductase